MERVFLSYSHKDRFFAELLQLKLEKEDVSVWRDRSALRAGEDWRAAIDAGVGEASVIIFIASVASCDSHYVTYEWASGMGKGKPVLPVIIEDCKLHPKIDQLQYLDLRRHDESSWLQIVQRVKEIIGGKEDLEQDEKDTLPLDGATLTDAERNARDRIRAYLIEKGYRMMSFDRIREKIDQNYRDEFLKQLAVKVDEFAIAYLKGPKVGIKLR
jgi:hypothetical protein